jgi:signal transduction histidine kinase
VPEKKDFDENELNLILEEIGRMEATIEGLLDFSRERPLRRTCHDLKGPIRRALNLIEGRARQQKVVLRIIEVEESLFVNGDAEQLHQVFVNLLINAIEAMPDGGCLAITLSLPESRSHVQIQIHDTGNGIPEEILLRIFEPFATTKERGTGLGLAVSRRIIDQHGGSLFAQNAAEGGALFTIELPVAADQVSVHAGELVATI